MRDTWRFALHSSVFKLRGSQGNQKAKLTLYFHKIEKAMALPKPRAGFGRAWILSDFLPLLEHYCEDFGYDDTVGACCLNLEAYCVFNQQMGAKWPDLEAKVAELLNTMVRPESGLAGGVKMLTRQELNASGSMNFSRFVATRHSVRNFSTQPVSKDVVECAVSIAQRTPSVCNRQPWHVYGICEKRLMRAALELQNGNAGFSENIQILLIVVGDLSTMLTPGERNEIWVDGGMFSMSLVYALHSLGLGTCCLNLCHNASEEDHLRELVGIAAAHRPIMMIAIGQLPEVLMVACSQRKRTEEVLDWVHAEV